MSEKERLFWGKYAGCLLKYGVLGRNAEWHVWRAQDFAYGLKGLKLNALDSAYLDSYLDVIGRNEEMEAWQLRQVVYALRILFLEMTRLEWPAAYDWEGRLSACEDLKPTHPTLAREIPLEKPAPEPKPCSGLDARSLRSKPPRSGGCTARPGILRNIMAALAGILEGQTLSARAHCVCPSSGRLQFRIAAGPAALGAAVGLSRCLAGTG